MTSKVELEGEAVANRPLKIGDRVELLLWYSLEGAPPPKGRVVSIGRCVSVKMDRSSKVIRFAPSDLRIIKRGKAR